MNEQFAYLVLPGIYGSDKHHWQTIWEHEQGMVRFAPDSWDLPELENWETALTSAVEASSKPVVLVVHSLANILVGHWAPKSELAQRVAGAFMVSVPDPSGPNYPADAPSFVDPPQELLPFPSLVVASDDDPFGNMTYTQHLARAWGAGGIVTYECHGHINSSSNLGRWQAGHDLLTAFVAGLCPPRRTGTATR